MISLCRFDDRSDVFGRARRVFVALFGLVLGAALVMPSPARAVCSEFGLPPGSEIVEFQTNRGQICLELLRADAPITVWNFLNYVIRGDYDGTIVHRSVPGFVIQGGAFETNVDSARPISTDATIQNESCTPDPGDTLCSERGNLRGSVAMARVGGQINSATSQYFINLDDNRNPLDFVDEGFTVFANVLGDGMVVADEIAALPIAAPDESWWLAPPVGSVLGELPLQTDVPFFPTSFGCWDPLDLALVVSPSSHTNPLPDPFFGTAIYPLSGGCGTRIPRNSFTEDPGPPECPDFDLLTTGVTGPVSLSIRIDPATLDYLQYEFSCLQTADAVIQRDLWRDDLGARMVPELVVIQSATYQTVPEPGFGVLLAAGAWGLSIHSRRKRTAAFR